MGIDIKTIPQAFELPRPRWPVIEAWIEALEAPLIDRFNADGPSGCDNLYLLFRRDC